MRANRSAVLTRPVTELLALPRRDEPPLAGGLRALVDEVGIEAQQTDELETSGRVTDRSQVNHRLAKQVPPFDIDIDVEGADAMELTPALE
jgi:hypothetical protein